MKTTIRQIDELVKLISKEKVGKLNIVAHYNHGRYFYEVELTDDSLSGKLKAIK